MNYLTPVPIEDPRLTPELERIRNGSEQGFRKPGRRDFGFDFTINPPMRHVYAELMDGKWYWVNGCDECHGREGSWTTYKKCPDHDVCFNCKTPRSELREIPWGHPSGFECKPCNSKRREIEKAEALAKVAAKKYREWDYTGCDYPTCPYCDLEYDGDHHLWKAEDEVVICERCDNKFEVTAEHSVTFTNRRMDEDL